LLYPESDRFNALPTGRHCGGIFGVDWSEADYTKKAVAVAVQANLLAER